MELRQLSYFIKLAETLNFSTAARELFITQSTLSHQILQLEREFDQALFLRNSHEVSLTEAGEQLLPLAKATVRSADHCRSRLEELKNLMTGELNIGVTYSFGSIAAETVTAFLRRYPHVKMNVMQATMATLMERLLHHDLDFVLAFKPTTPDPRIDSEELFHHRLAAIVSESHPLAKHKQVTLEELQRYDLALPKRGTQARNALERLTSGTDYQYNIKVEMNTVYMLFRLIRESNYVTVLSEGTIYSEKGLSSVPIKVTGTQENDMVGCIHQLRNVHVKNSTKEFVKMMKESAVLLRDTLLSEEV